MYNIVGYSCSIYISHDCENLGPFKFNFETTEDTRYAKKMTHSNILINKYYAAK